MEGICEPYSGKVALDEYCFGVLGFNAVDSVFFSVLILAELFVHKVKLCSRPNQTVLVLVSFTVFWYFLCLTLTLFFLPVSQVSVAEVCSSVLQILLWLLIFNCYYKHYSPYEFCKTPLISLKFFMIFRLFCFVYQIFTVFMIVPDESQQKVVMWVRFTATLIVTSLLGVVLYKKKLEIDEFLLEDDSELNEYEKAGIFSRLSMHWAYGLLKLGSLRPLENSDIGKLRDKDRAEYQHLTLSSHMSTAYDESEKHGLLKTIVSRYKWDLAGITALGILASLLDFATPAYISLIEAYLHSDDPVWKGVAIVVYLLMTKIIRSLINTQYDFLDLLLSLHVKSALSCEAYEKMLKISTNSISQNKDDSLSYGKIVNIIQVDVESIISGMVNVMNLMVLPFTWALGFYLIFVTLGLEGGISGTTIIIVLIGANILTGRGMSHAQKQLMEKKDIRMKACNELLSNIRIFKVYNWEQKLAERIYKAREVELACQKKVFVYQIINSFLGWGATNYISAGIITTMALSGMTLTPTNVYAGLSAVRIVKQSLTMFPSIINSFIQSKVSLARIQGFFRAKDQNLYIQRSYGRDSIEIKNSSFTWDLKQENKDGELQETKRVLKDLNVSVRRGELVAVVGKFASGKSSFLQALIQNMVLLGGDDSSVVVNGRIAYCNQESWILNKTIKENILFYKEFDEEKYNEVLRVCFLNKDLDLFPGGDLTEIGERGINLSGGQKVRVTIARSVYSNADIFLFDDPLAALDQYVGRNLFEQCILKYLAGKTRVLVTNNQQYLSHADRILCFKDGEIVQSGTFSELSQTKGYFSEEFMVEIRQAKLGEKQEIHIKKEPNSSGRKLISSEERAVGSVKPSVYFNYLRDAGGATVVCFALLWMTLWQVDRMYTDIYLADWTNQSAKEQRKNLIKNIIVYTTGSLVINVFIILRSINNFSSGLRAARKLFVEMLNSLLNASIPLFYDVNPMGRVLNRFSKDQNMVDAAVAGIFNMTLGQLFLVGLYIVFCVYTVPLVLLTIPVTIYLSRRIQLFYLSSSRELTRLESISRSPIVQFFSETLSGLSTIRAFSYETHLKEHFVLLFNTNLSLNFYKNGCSCWLSIMLELISDIILTCSTLAIVFSRGEVDPGLVGACLIYAMMIPDGIYAAIKATTNLENAMVSVERIQSMSSIEQEDDRTHFKDDLLISKSWPSEGLIEFLNYSARYRPDTDLVLKTLNFTIFDNEKIGIMGRTGSGKSSLVNALFRVISSDSGSILISGVDIAEIGLNLLRQKLCVIPQDPALFRGKLRDNIDPLKSFTDQDVEDVLKSVKLDLGGGDFEVADGASNLSVGQKQLICIARALLRGSKIVVLDEATANIDFKTDILIQEIIKEKFRKCTVITIAHRINTILESDRILVMDGGKVAEFDTPENLKMMNGLFCKLSTEH